MSALARALPIEHINGSTDRSEIAKGTDAWWTSMQDRLLGLARTRLSDVELETAESTRPRELVRLPDARAVQ